MSVTMQRMNERVEREVTWQKFLASLVPWQIHALFAGEGELIAHDNFVEGLVSLGDIRAMLAAHADTPFLDVTDPRD